MNRPLLPALVLLAVCAAAAFAGGKKEAAATAVSEAIPETGAAGELDGQGMSIMITTPQAGDLASGDEELPEHVRRILASNFTRWSGGMTIYDDKTLSQIIDEGETGAYANQEAFAQAGRVKATHVLTGTLSRASPTEYVLELTVSEVGGARRAASVRRAAPAEFWEGAALNQASEELLTGLEVRLTPEAKTALSRRLNDQTGGGSSLLDPPNLAAMTDFQKLEYYTKLAQEYPGWKEASQRLTEIENKVFGMPAIRVPDLATRVFTPPVIQPVDTGAIGEDARSQLAQYDAARALLQKQQKDLLGQRQNVLDQWRDFLRELDDKRALVREQEQRVLQEQRNRVNLLRQAEAWYADHPPFSIVYDPRAEQYGKLDLANRTMTLRFEIASEPGSVGALSDVLDSLSALNGNFAAVNKGYADLNAVMDVQFRQVEAAMKEVRVALDEVNAEGKRYNVAPASANWAVQRGSTVNGAALTTSWQVSYPHTFVITASLLNKADKVIGRGSVTLTNSVSRNGSFFQSEMAIAWCVFENVKIEEFTDEKITVRIDTVNGRDAAAAAAAGYIAITADRAPIDAERARLAAEKARLAAENARLAAEWVRREAERLRREAEQRQRYAAEAAERARQQYWANHFYSLGVAAGTAFTTPAFLVSAKAMLFSTGNSDTFLEAGSDFGLVHGEDIRDAEYFSIAPYLHANLGGITPGANIGVYMGIGAGANFSWYTYPPESHIDPVMASTWVFDFNIGYLFWPSSRHSLIDLRYTIKTNFEEVSHRLTLGYTYRFGYF